MALPIWGKFFSKVYADKHLKVSKSDFQKPKTLDPNLEMDCTKYDAETESPANEEGNGIFD
jgi:penicillin-binding protein 1A